MAEFQNCLISRIFAAFFEHFFAQNTSNVIADFSVFRIFLTFLIFDPYSQFCKDYSPCMRYGLCQIADFQNCLISWIFGVFSSGFLHRTTVMLVRNVFRMFVAFLTFDLDWPFCKDYNSLCMGFCLCKMDFQNCLISRIFSVFFSSFLHRTTLMLL